MSAGGGGTGSPGGRVSAVILTRNRPDALRAAVASIVADCGELIIVGNDATPDALATMDALAAEYAVVRLHKSADNLGCSGGRRVGGELAAGEFVFFLDDDAVADPGALPALVADLDAHAEAQAISSMVLTPGRIVEYAGGSLAIDADYARFTLNGRGLAQGDPALAPTGPCGWSPGGAMLARASMLERCSFDAGMAAYYEDNDWAMRARALWPEPFRQSADAKVLHFSADRPDFADESARRRFVADRLEVIARFFDQHGLIIDAGGLEIEAVLGTGRVHPAPTRLLLRLVSTYGRDWFLEQWTTGDIGGALAWEQEREAQLREEHAGQMHDRQVLVDFLTEAVRATEERERVLQARVAELEGRSA